ncbi:MAG: hypothetical protein IPI46_09325 [Bacteroidetes bacterium]|nr:hypothetical protein [Bacteroidota bacterium]
MKEILLCFYLVVITINSQAQSRFKPVSLIESWSVEDGLSESTDSNYVVKRMDTSQFLSILQNQEKIIIEFWQPWCKGSKYTIPNCKLLLNACNEAGITYLLISDSRFDQDYFRLDSLKVGRIVYLINNGKINFVNYIISSGLQLDDYVNMIYRYTNFKPVERNSCFYIENKKVLYHNYSYHFYKKDVKKIFKRVAKNKVADTPKKGFTLNFAINKPIKFFIFNLY